MITLGVSLSTPMLVLSDVNRECRGVAAGVVSSMRANNEIDSDEMMKTAALAARRACVAALEGFSINELDISESEKVMESEESSSNHSDQNKEMSKMSVWEFLSQDQEGNAGHDRLKKRRQ